MGLQTEIGLVVAQPNALQRTLQRVAAVRSLSPLLLRLVTPIDRALHRLTDGKLSVTAGLVAFPTVMLTTIGARSGEARTTPLAAIPVRDDLALIGSNAGSGRIPGWVFNLRANREATISYEGRVAHVVASPAGPAEHEEVFVAAARIYAGYAGFQGRVDYTIPVFTLRSAAGQGQRGEMTS